jgi:basic membrane protein A and related proteins
MKKNLFSSILVFIVLSLALVACGGNTANNNASEEVVVEPANNNASEEVVVEPAAPEFTAALVHPGALGDRSFSDSAHRGVVQANDEGIAEVLSIETQGVSEHETAMRAAIAEGYDLVMGLALDAGMMIALAEEFPDQKFGAPSDVFAAELPENLAAYIINVHESSFLVGYIAGTLTETGIVGAVVGGEAPSLNQFFYGYKQGVLEACPDCEVLVSYLGFDFGNPTLGLETASAQYDLGADIIFQVAGLTGEGVISAAGERGLYAIGVDSNQDDIQPGNVIVSMIKRVDVTTYSLVASVVDGSYVGGFSSLGLADGAAGLSWDEGSTTFADNGPASMTDKLPALAEKVEEYRTMILSGEYEVCNALVETAVCDPLK